MNIFIFNRYFYGPDVQVSHVIKCNISSILDLVYIYIYIRKRLKKLNI